MYNCPHCGKATFVGGGICNHCKKDFIIAKLEDVFMKSEVIEAVATRIVPGDNGASHVVMLQHVNGKKGPTKQIGILEFRPSGDGWKHWTGWSMELPLAGDVANAILEVAP